MATCELSWAFFNGTVQIFGAVDWFFNSEMLVFALIGWFLSSDCDRSSWTCPRREMKGAATYPCVAITIFSAGRHLHNHEPLLPPQLVIMAITPTTYWTTPPLTYLTPQFPRFSSEFRSQALKGLFSERGPLLVCLSRSLFFLPRLCFPTFRECFRGRGWKFLIFAEF